MDVYYITTVSGMELAEGIGNRKQSSDFVPNVVRVQAARPGGLLGDPGGERPGVNHSHHGHQSATQQRC